MNCKVIEETDKLITLNYDDLLFEVNFRVLVLTRFLLSYPVLPVNSYLFSICFVYSWILLLLVFPYLTGAFSYCQMLQNEIFLLSFNTLKWNVSTYSKPYIPILLTVCNNISNISIKTVIKRLFLTIVKFMKVNFLWGFRK